jgi:hypothetical protein
MNMNIKTSSPNEEKKTRGLLQIVEQASFAVSKTSIKGLKKEKKEGSTD